MLIYGVRKSLFVCGLIRKDIVVWDFIKRGLLKEGEVFIMIFIV